MRFTGHAVDRCTEFGLTLDVVERITRHPSVVRTSTGGRTITVSDVEPEWAVVTGPDGVVVTVVPRTSERWEHKGQHVGPRTRGIVDTDAYADVEPVAQPSTVTARKGTRKGTGRARVKASASSIDPRCLAAARELAHGNLSLVVVRPDTGAVWVANTLEAARRLRLA